MHRAIIIDDEQMGIKTLKAFIEECTNRIKVVATTTKPIEGIDLIEDYKPDIVFLDISMPGLNGFELLEKVTYRDFKLVFTTAHGEYAIKAIKNKAYDYLLKPIDIDELKDCIERIIDIKEGMSVDKAIQTEKDIIELPVRDGIVFIKPEEIIRIEASGSYTTFHMVNGVKHIGSSNLKEFESILNPRYFYRCHNSHIINLRRVNKFLSSEGLYCAVMEDGSNADIAKKNKQVFLDKLKGF